MKLFKQQVIDACKSRLGQRKASLAAALLGITESMQHETKSSVGDKHETSRARMQSEQDKLQGQLNEISDQEQELLRIDPLSISESIFSGTVVETNQGIFFIAIPLGKIIADSRYVMVVSPGSPIGKLLMGLRTHDVFELNGLSYTIESYY
jgi:transcription elongation GreA/GreB family factor